MSTLYSAVALMYRGPHILLLERRADDRTYTGWCLPGGMSDGGEGARETVVRELEEETGLDWHSPIYKFRLWTTHVVKNTPLRIDVFTVNAPEGEVLLSEEHIGFRWVTLEEALSFDLAGSATRQIIGNIISGKS